MDIESLKPVLSLLLWGALFFVMMRFGCGAHMMGGHGHGHGHGGHDDGTDGRKDPICGMDVSAETAKAATVYQGTTYYFCSTACRDKFEANPKQYSAHNASREDRHG